VSFTVPSCFIKIVVMECLIYTNKCVYRVCLVCVFVCICACMYVCMYACMYVIIIINIKDWTP
jgi:hypothetical protein